MNEPAQQTYRCAFRGDGGTLFGIWIVNLLLTILTLGIYHAWARTRVRRYVWSNLEFAGERLSYHGTGGELFVGWLKAMGLFILLLAQMFVWMSVLGQETGATVGAVFLYVAIIGAVPFAIYGATRYRISRTSYRGVRFSLRGSTGEFSKVFFRDILITMFTLGICTPILLNNIQDYITNNIYYGNSKFQYDGRAGDFFVQYLIPGWLLVLPTLGISTFWARAVHRNYVMNRTTFQGARFQSYVDGAGLLLLVLTNMLMVIFTLGLATPWAQVRVYRYHADHLAAFGVIDFDAVRQEMQAAGATAEGVTDLLGGDGFNIGGL